MPPRQPCRPDRDAFGPARRPSCLPCRHVAAFKTHPPPFSRPQHFSSGQPLHGRPLQKCSPKISRVSPLHRSGMLSDDSDPNRHRDPHSADDSPFLSPSRNPIRYAPASCPQAFQLQRCRLRRQRSTSNASPPCIAPSSSAAKGSPIPHKLLLGNTPALRPPKGRPAVKRMRPRKLRVILITADNSYSGRKPSAPIVLPGSWPCRPSTRPPSRSSQPACRRIYHNPSPTSPQRFCGHVRRLRKLAADHAHSLAVP